VATCSACHGPNGQGVQGLGKDMTHSEFIAGLSDEELLAFIREGRPIDDPANTTGVIMPPSGGNPSLSDEQMMDIIAFIRSIHE
jgi:mono/diheme cytochrome c family protein